MNQSGMHSPSREVAHANGVQLGLSQVEAKLNLVLQKERTSKSCQNDETISDSVAEDIQLVGVLAYKSGAFSRLWNDVLKQRAV